VAWAQPDDAGNGIGIGIGIGGSVAHGGFSEKGLDHLHDVLSGHVERGELPGLVALAAHGGTTHVEVIGHKTFGDPAPMPRDAVFRIASLSKPIGAVAALMLVEDATLRLDAAVEEWLPELANRRVLRTIVPAPAPVRAARHARHGLQLAARPARALHNGLYPC
jgi:CubicO group peptidase (beta-lactamase class C family)